MTSHWNELVLCLVLYLVLVFTGVSWTVLHRRASVECSPSRYGLSTIRTSTFLTRVEIGTCASIRTTAGPLCPQSCKSNSVYLWWPQGLWLPQLASHNWKRRRTRYPTSQIHRQEEQPYLVGVMDGTQVFYHASLHVTVLSSTTTVDQMELDGAPTRYLAHDCDVGLAEVRRSTRVPPREFLSNPYGSGVRPHKVFSSSSRGVRPRKQRGP